MTDHDALEAVLPYLHQARRSGALLVGYQAVRRSLRRGDCSLVLLAKDAGDSLRRLDTGGVPMIPLADRAGLGAWLGRREVAILGLGDPHLAAGLRARLESAKGR